MSVLKNDQALRLVFQASISPLSLDIQGFLIDCEARNLSPNTLRIYRNNLHAFEPWLFREGAHAAQAITPPHIRAYLLHLKGQGHNPGGIHQAYRVLKTFLRWLVREGDLPSSPMKRVRAPRVPERTIQPVPISSIRAMLRVCDQETLAGARDHALIRALLDTGCRAGELLGINLEDVALKTGAILLRNCKGGKSRVVFLGRKSRKALLRYLRKRGPLEGQSALWVSRSGDRLTYWGLVSMLKRRARKAAVEAPYPHDFRRAFALASLRGGMDIVTLQRIIGHSDLAVLRRYLAQTAEDLRAAHEVAGPVDRLL